MEPCSKRTRGRGGGSSGVDRLSALPDDLLHAILSSLKARQVVQTSVLSRRWRSLWRSVPCLDVDQDDFRVNPEPLTSQNQKDLGKFEDFVNSLLLRRDGSVLHTFRLCVCESFAGHMHAGRWIRRALACSRRALHVHCDAFDDVVHMPLDLGPSLTRLHLSNLSLDARFAESVSSVCVVLEDLELIGCGLCFDNITSTSLRNLCIETGTPDYDRPAPRLTSLRLLIQDQFFQVSVNEMPSLVKASISYWSPDEEAAIQETQRKLVSNVGNVTTVELTDFLQMMVPDMEPVEFPAFRNLRNLVLVGCDLRDDFQLLRHFLQKSPNLEELTIRCCWLPEGFAGDQGTTKLKKLKYIEIIYKYHQGIRELVCFLLEISDRVPKNTITLTKV
ncbi:unnamed protein product [Urochloa decumbens]|uniref:F-box domain-containing protein n=1 Tax=Urochloa decumbens TaxID=240449 RepID=A0ABC9F2F2_9POAL